jgi:serine/threonine protein kinase
VIKELQPADPARIGPYRLIGRLGAGGMGRVYVARSPGGRIVAIKVIRPELAEDRGFRERFAQEVSAARHVSGIFTAAVIDSDTDGETPWMATAYVQGPSLHDAVDEHGPLHADSVLALAAGLAEGLQAIHRAGLVHRDLKPSNVLLAADGPRVIDFGISRALEGSRLTETGMLVGSPGFMSPEQALGQVVGPPSDVFSLGAVLTFAATGEGPFGGGPTLGLMFRVVHESPDLTRVPDELRLLLEACLAKEPAYRPSPGQLLESLDEGIGVLTPEWLPASVTATFSQYVPPSGPRSAAQPGPAPQGYPTASDVRPGGSGAQGSGARAPGTPAPVASPPVTPAPGTPAPVTPAPGFAGAAPAWSSDTQATLPRPSGGAAPRPWAPGPPSPGPGAPIVPPEHAPPRRGRKRWLLTAAAAAFCVAVVAGVAAAMTQSSGGTHTVDTGQTASIASSPSPALAGVASPSATATPTPSVAATTSTPTAASAPPTTPAATWPTTQPPTSWSPTPTDTTTATATATDTSTPTTAPSDTSGTGCSPGCSPTPVPSAAATNGP